MDVELTPSFTLMVRNCTTVPAVGSLVTLVYSTPSGDSADPEQFGSMDLRVDFTSSSQQVSIPIEEADSSGTGDHVIDVLVSSFSLADGGSGSLSLGETVQVQRFEDPGFSSFIPLSEVKPLLDRQIRLSGVVSPISGITESTQTNEECYNGFADSSDVLANNLGRIPMVGSMRAKSICSKTLGTPTPCNSGGEIGLHSARTPLVSDPQAVPPTSVFEPESCILGTSTDNNAKFADCCDPQPTVLEADEAAVTVQCNQVIITAIEIDGVMTQLSPAYPSPWHRDVDPTLAAPAEYKESLVAIQCNSFLNGTPSFEAEPTSCGNNYRKDRDHDGIVDSCDYLIAPFDDGSGSQKGILQRHFRMKDFKDGGTEFTSFATTEVANVSIDGTPVPTQFGTIYSDLKNSLTNALTFTVPDDLSPGPHLITVNPTDTELSPETARNSLNTPMLALLPVGGADYLEPFDEASAQNGFIDQDGSYENSVIELPAGAAPTSVVFSREPNNTNRELYISADDSMFAYDLEEAHFLDLDPGAGEGTFVGASAREVFLEESGRFAFVLHDTGDVGAIQVQRFDILETAIPDNQRFTSYPSVVTVDDLAAGLTVKNLTMSGNGNPRFQVFVSWSCNSCVPTTVNPCSSIAQAHDNENLKFAGVGKLASDPSRRPLPITAVPSAGLYPMALLSPLLTPECQPGDCPFLPDPGDGGGSGSSEFRKTWLGVRVLEANLDPGGTFLDPVTPWTQECDENILLWQEAVAVGAPLWDRLGMALSTDAGRVRLYAVSPDSNELMILDAATGATIERVDTGFQPSDVAAVDLPIPGQGLRERVYVANRGQSGVPDDDVVTIIDPLNPVAGAVKTTSLNALFDDSQDLSIMDLSVSSNDFIVFLSSALRQTVYVLSAAANGDLPSERGSFAVGPEPRRVSTQSPGP